MSKGHLSKGNLSEGHLSEGRARAALWTRDFLLISLANLAVFTGFQMLMPTMPVYVQSLGGSETMMGLVIGIFTLSAVAIRPLVGWALDAVGRKVILLLGLAVFVFSALLYGWAPSVAALLGIRLLHGCGWGFSTTAAGTVAADVIPAERLGEGMGFFGLAGTIAMAVAPALGLYVIDRFSFLALFGLSASLAAVALLLAAPIGYRLPHPTDQAATPTRPAVSGRPRATFFEPGAVRPGLVTLLTNTTYGAVVTFLALYATQQGIANIGPFFTVYAVTLALTRPLSGVLMDRRGFDVVVVPGLICVAVAMLLLSVSRHLGMFLVAAVFCGLG
ncbi:MAG TPA: MFS transporter, partial [Firmicutes bacterium]|nr:MFS transporter [Bacillota bacterium]